MDIVVGVSVGSRACYHEYLQIEVVCLLDNTVEHHHGTAYLTGYCLEGKLVSALLKIHICRSARFIDCGGHFPVVVVVELDLLKGSARHLAVDIEPSVRIEASHLILTSLYAHLVPAVGRYIHSPCYSLTGGVPCALTDGVVPFLYRVGAHALVILGQIIASVICGEKRL